MGCMDAEFRAVPALPLALWLSCGVALPLFFAGVWEGYGGLVFSGLVIVVLSVISRPFVIRQGVCALLVGMATTGLHLLSHSDGYRLFLPREDAGAEIEAVIIEPLGSEAVLSDFDPPPSVAVRVERIRIDSEWRDCSGQTLVRFPKEPCRDDSDTWKYGERFRAEGGFQRPEPARFPGGFDDAGYLASRGMSHRYNATSMTSLGVAGPWEAALRQVYRWRDQWLDWEIRGVDRENAALLAAFTVGFRHGLEPELVDAFLRSGTVHVFAISGLHTGIVAGIFLVFLLLLRVPFRARALLLPVLLGGYVFITGCAPSATRAWLMISIYSLGRAFYRPVLPLQAVALAALVLLVWNPLNLLRPGFQFSFVIVGFLLVGWHRLMPAVRSLFEKEYWKPEAHRLPHWALVIAHRGTQLLCAGFLAWLGSAGLVLCANALFTPSTVPVNVGISLLLTPSFVVAFLKAALASVGVSFLDGLFAGTLNVLIGGIRMLAQAGSQAPGSLAVFRPDGAVVFAYYGLALSLLLVRSTRIRAACAAGLMVLVVGLLIVPAFLPARATVFHGAGLRTPAIVLFAKGVRRPTVINTGGYAWSRSLQTRLRQRGCNRIAHLVISRGRSECFYGGRELIAMYRPESLWLPAARTSPDNKRKLRELAALQRRVGGRVRWFDETDIEDRVANSATPDLGPTPLLQIQLHRDADKREFVVTRRHPRRTWTVRMKRGRTEQTALQFEIRPGAVRTLNVALTARPKMSTIVMP
ncbi:MAG: ComEC/Rec2 family competence protein [Verrucomicrobiota bacterium]